METAQAVILDICRNKSDDDIIRRIRRMSRPALERLYDIMGLEECDCPLVPIPCECGIVYQVRCRCPECRERADGGELSPATCPDCGMEPSYAACEHSRRRRYLPFEVLIVLEKLLDHPEPPAAPVPSALIDQVDLAKVRAERHGDDPHQPVYGLWHPQDAIMRSFDDGFRDRLGWASQRIRNGHAERGDLLPFILPHKPVPPPVELPKKKSA